MGEPEKKTQTLDLSKRALKKVPKEKDTRNVRVFLMDENELQTIEHMDSFQWIEKLSISKNHLLRMYGISRLHHLRELNLSFNRIHTIEGLKDCIALRYLNLEGNNIKNIEHLNNNIQLEHLNLADNEITTIPDLSFLRNLKELYLHGNKLKHLYNCDKYLPQSMEDLTLAKNDISDLNEICSLVNLTNLNSITISENPCVTMTAGGDGFDYRPFVLNWCMSLKVIDGFMVNPIESLKAEWLYSQGRGRSFRLGEHSALAKHLSTVCPLTGKTLESENERKLRLILSKAQQHQRQLQEEISENVLTSSVNSSPSSARKTPASRIQSPRFSRFGGRQGSTESMASSYHGNTVSDQLNQNPNASNNANSNVLMTTSLIENVKTIDTATTQIDSVNSPKLTVSHQSSQETNSKNDFQVFPHSKSLSQEVQTASLMSSINSPLVAASKMVPVPETLMSPDICPSTVAQSIAMSAINSPVMKIPHHLQQSDIKLLKNRESLEHSTNQDQSATYKCSPRRKPVSSSDEERTVIATDGNHSTHKEKPGKHQSLPSSSFLSNNSIHIAVHEDNDIHSGNFFSDASEEDHRYQKRNVPPKDGGIDNNNDGDEDDDDSDNFNVEKLKTIRNKAALRKFDRIPKRMTYEDSAIVIQKNWRGYRTRKKNQIIAEELMKTRVNEYIDKLTKDMEITKIQLENERKIQHLQMQAINALWKRVSTMQNEPLYLGANSSTANDGECTQSMAVVNELNRTCTMLTKQVQQLQYTLCDVVSSIRFLCNFPSEATRRFLASSLLESLQRSFETVATQTDITAVHTPQTEQFPYASRMRPSSLTFSEASSTTPRANESDAGASNSNSPSKQQTTPCNTPRRKTLEENGDDNSHQSP